MHRFGCEANTYISVMQYFEPEWDAYIDIEDASAVPDRSRIKCNTQQLDFIISTAMSSLDCSFTSTIADVSTPNIADQLSAGVVTTGIPAACAEPPASAKQSWPLDYKLPSQFPENVTFALQQQTNLNKPKERYIRGLFVQNIVYNVLRQYTLYPDKAQKTDMARAIIREFPHLRDLSTNGYSSWYQSVTDCLKNARRTLKSVPEVAKRSRKKKLQLSTTVASVEPTAVSVSGPEIVYVPGAGESVPVSQCLASLAVGAGESVPVSQSLASLAVAAGGSAPVGQSLAVGAGESVPVSQSFAVGAGESVPVSQSLVSLAVGAGESVPVSQSLASLAVGAGGSVPVGQSLAVGAGESVPVVQSFAVGAGGSVPVSQSLAHSVPLKRKFLQDDCDLYYAPKAGDTLGDDELETCCQLMNDIVRSEHVSRDEVRLIELLKQTYPNRRMLINDRVTCSEVRHKYPGLFTVTGLLTDYAEMTRQRYSHHLMPSFRRNLSAVATSVMTLTERSAGSKTKVGKQFASKCLQSICFTSYYTHLQYYIK